MSDYIKTVQSRLSRKNISLSREQIRPMFEQVVADQESATEEELNFITEQLEEQFKAGSLVQSDAQALDKTSGAIAAQGSQKLSYEEISSAIDAEFGSQSTAKKMAVLDFTKDNIYRNVQELRAELALLQEAEEEILNQIILEYSARALKNQENLQQSLATTAAKMQEKNQAFLTSFRQSVSLMKAEFGL